MSNSAGKFDFVDGTIEKEYLYPTLNKALLRPA
jgi:hypothetical protein